MYQNVSMQDKALTCALQIFVTKRNWERDFGQGPVEIGQRGMALN